MKFWTRDHAPFTLRKVIATLILSVKHFQKNNPGLSRSECHMIRDRPRFNPSQYRKCHINRDWLGFNPAHYSGRIVGPVDPGYFFRTCSHQGLTQVESAITQVIPLVSKGYPSGLGSWDMGAVWWVVTLYSCFNTGVTRNILKKYQLYKPGTIQGVVLSEKLAKQRPVSQIPEPDRGLLGTTADTSDLFSLR